MSGADVRPAQLSTQCVANCIVGPSYG